MENIKILIDGIQKDVNGIFYSFDSKYYFIYTEKEVDENNYVILYMAQVGREIKNTENGPVDTGYMVGVEITNPEEQKKVQTSISYIVEDKKNNTTNPLIQYLPMSMLTNLKIISKKRFKLIKSIMIDNFKLKFEEELPVLENIEIFEEQSVSNNNVSSDLLESTISTVEPLVTPIPGPVDVIAPVTQNQKVEQPVVESSIKSFENQASLPLQAIQNLESTTAPEALPSSANIIVDYRSKYFEEEEKNKELQIQIDELTKKLEEIKKVLE